MKIHAGEKFNFCIAVSVFGGSSLVIKQSGTITILKEYSSSKQLRDDLREDFKKSLSPMIQKIIQERYISVKLI